MVTVASLLQIMDYVGSLDSSRDLQPIHAKSFINRLHLVLQISKIHFHFNAFTAFLRLRGGTKHTLITNGHRPRPRQRVQYGGAVREYATNTHPAGRPRGL